MANTIVGAFQSLITGRIKCNCTELDCRSLGSKFSIHYKHIQYHGAGFNICCIILRYQSVTRIEPIRQHRRKILEYQCFQNYGYKRLPVGQKCLGCWGHLMSFLYGLIISNISLIWVSGALFLVTGHSQAI
jgi:hypothetical protein